MVNSSALRNKAKEILKKEGRINASAFDEFKDFILPGLENSKNILDSIYFKPPQRVGFFGKIKTLIQNKIINTTINVIEKPSMRQQKFNNLTYNALQAINKDIEFLKKEIELLKNKTNSTDEASK